MATIQAFNEIKVKALPESEGIYGLNDLRKALTLQIGGDGDRAFRSDEQGIWLGAKKFVNAPFSVDMDGNIIATTGNFLTKTDTGQSLSGNIEVGEQGILIDGVNNRIIINDGTNDRVLIGKDVGGF